MDAVVTETAPVISTFLGRILQIALGIFVTTSDLPPYSSNETDMATVNYNCTFDKPCRWFSEGDTADHWRLAQGEPELFLWLTSTGTIQRPGEPFAMIELRGQQADRFLSDEIQCQDGTALLSFTYWIMGGANLKVCLVDLLNKKFNCTPMLGERPMPRKVLLSLPHVQEPFRIAIIPNIAIGMIAIDDIGYDGVLCQREISTVTLIPLIKSENFNSSQKTVEEITFGAGSGGVTITSSTESTLAIESTEPPFDLLIIGSKTTPFFDNRRGRIISNNTMLFCDFANNFLCLWGPESGRWGIIQEGALPSVTVPDGFPVPSYPVAIVIQGTAMLTSDPLKCQTGSGKLIFRHWTNGSPTVQACAIGYGIGSKKVECMGASQDDEIADDKSLLVFDFKQSILEPFTLNIIPQWDNTARNQYLIINEIAYLGNCDTKKLNEEISERSLTEQNGNIIWTKSKTYENFVWTIEKDNTESPREKQNGKASKSTSVPRTNYSKQITLPPIITSDQSLTDSTYLNYCELLNCNFEENACNYLNHGLTKVPWILRSSDYETILKLANLLPFPPNDHFISTTLSPGQYAILESPRFKTTSKAEIVLFQYYRSSFYANIRICLYSCSIYLHKNSSTFARCPSLILGAQLSRKTREWYTARIQLPARTTRFCLVAHNSNQSITDTVVAIRNIMLASCNSEKDAVVDMNYYL
ncbi:unnamed protein product [Cercopithifilaria johnstoni]|uniref:MAM domain-containing protein n=1 Tax=Cercopithifilaria johnstoni TaxID=2874296 RepID=A0A8J2M4U9_9BILA|nr:unnamed protein product [Cercopithifilaria johnstoni]